MITVQHLTKRYGTHMAIEDVNFDVKQGEILGFLGPNGAGKTTTMRIITCFMPPSEGTVQVAGFDCLEQPQEVKQRIGYLPESPPLYQELTVTEYLRFVGQLKRLPPSRVPGRMAQVIEQLGLDPKQIIEIRDVIRGLAGTHTVILSTHILSEATAICDRVVIIDRGHIVAEDTPAQLSSRLRQSEKISLTVKHPPDNWRERLSTIPGVLQVIQGATAETSIIEYELGQDLREDIAQFVVNQGVGLLELKPLSLSLEDVFLQLTQQDENPAHAQDTAPDSHLSSSVENQNQA